MNAEPPVPSGLRAFLAFGVGMAGGLGGVAGLGRRPAPRRSRREPQPSIMPMWLQWVLAFVVWGAMAASAVIGGLWLHSLVGALLGFIAADVAVVFFWLLVAVPVSGVLRAVRRRRSRRHP